MEFSLYRVITDKKEYFEYGEDVMDAITYTINKYGLNPKRVSAEKITPVTRLLDFARKVA